MKFFSVAFVAVFLCVAVSLWFFRRWMILFPKLNAQANVLPCLLYRLFLQWIWNHRNIWKHTNAWLHSLKSHSLLPNIQNCLISMHHCSKKSHLKWRLAFEKRVDRHWNREYFLGFQLFEWYKNLLVNERDKYIFIF